MGVPEKIIQIFLYLCQKDNSLGQLFVCLLITIGILEVAIYILLMEFKRLSWL